MKKLLKGAALVAALVLIGFVVYLYSMFAGNPLLALLARHNVSAYLEEAYPALEYQTVNCYYDYKFVGGYCVSAESPVSPDSRITVETDFWGTVTGDDYDLRVNQGLNTLQRLNAAYSAQVEAILKDPVTPFETRQCTARFVQSSEYGAEEGHRIDPATLELDGVYDLRELGAKAGVLTVFVRDEPTSDRALELMREIRQRMDEAGATFYILELTIEPPLDEDGAVYQNAFILQPIHYDSLTEIPTETEDAL